MNEFDDLKWKATNLDYKLQHLKEELSLERNEMVIPEKQFIESIRNWRTATISFIVIGITAVFGLTPILNNSDNSLWVLLVAWIISGVAGIVILSLISHNAFHILARIRRGYTNTVQFLADVQISIPDLTYDLNDVTEKELDNIDNFISLVSNAADFYVFDVLNRESRHRSLSKTLKKELEGIRDYRSVTAEEIQEAYDEVDFEILPNDLKNVIHPKVFDYMKQKNNH